jgi:hypothetical protein
MKILRVLKNENILNSMSARPFLSALLARGARTLLCEWRPRFGGALEYMAAKIAAYFRSEPNRNYIRARISRQSKSNEYKIIDRKVGDDHRR